MLNKLFSVEFYSHLVNINAIIMTTINLTFPPISIIFFHNLSKEVKSWEENKSNLVL